MTRLVLLLLAFVREISARGNTVIAGFILLSRKIATSGGCPPRNDADAGAGATAVLG